jgi:hypothetical protein
VNIYRITTVLELTKSKAEAKQLYDQMVAQKKTNEGFKPFPDRYEAPPTKVTTEAWHGHYLGAADTPESVIEYYYDSYVSSWVFVTEAYQFGS